jgi:hypothetical protein
MWRRVVQVLGTITHPHLAIWIIIGRKRSRNNKEDAANEEDEDQTEHTGDEEECTSRTPLPLRDIAISDDRQDNPK